MSLSVGGRIWSILQVCACGGPDQAGIGCHNQLTRCPRGGQATLGDFSPDPHQRASLSFLKPNIASISPMPRRRPRNPSLLSGVLDEYLSKELADWGNGRRICREQSPPRATSWSSSITMAKLCRLPLLASSSNDAIIGREGHWQSRIEKRPGLIAKIATNSLSQCPAPASSAVNPRKSPHNFTRRIFSSYIRDLLADQGGFKLPIGFSKYPFEMSAEFPLMSRKMAY
jgi:hypothetical protein